MFGEVGACTDPLQLNWGFFYCYIHTSMVWLHELTKQIINVVRLIGLAIGFFDLRVRFFATWILSNVSLTKIRDFFVTKKKDRRLSE